MDNTAVYKAIKQMVNAQLSGLGILLFGSHACGNHDSKSDYNLLIITPKTFTSKEKIALSTQLDHSIINNIKIPVDLLINSEDEVQQKQLLPGHIIRSALKEGIFFMTPALLAYIKSWIDKAEHDIISKKSNYLILNT